MIAIKKLDDLLKYEYFSRSPMRISLAGGGTDVGSYPDEFGGVVINVTISIFARASMIFRKDRRIIVREKLLIEEFESFDELKVTGKHGIVLAVLEEMNKEKYGVEINLFSGTRARSGLGGSAALFVTLLSLFNHIKGEYQLDNYRLAELAWSLERFKLGNLGGRQDQYATVFGGLNYLEFLRNGFVRVSPIPVENHVLYQLGTNLMLFWLGDRSSSGQVIEDQIAKISSKKNLESLHLAKKLANEMKYTLLRGDVMSVGYLLRDGWEAKKGFSAKVTTPEIEEFHDRLVEVGMIGGKITGAGGGGHFLAFSELKNRQKIIDAAVAMGAQYIPFDICMTGAQAWHFLR